MPRPRPLALLLAVTLYLSQALAAQESAPPHLETPLLAEFAVGPAIIGGGPWAPSTSGIMLSLVWVGFQQEKGYRLGLAASRADIKDAVPTSPAEGLVRARNAALLSVERIRIRKPGPWVIITGIGAGFGSLGYDFDNTRNDATTRSDPVEGWAPALTASADAAWRVPMPRLIGQAHPLDLFIGARSALLLGVRRVGDEIPGSGEVRSTRGIAHVQSLAIGMRIGLLSDWFR
jgi:hypothetical protein